MAGIGFELNKILSRQGYAATFQAYAYAGLIGSGPWLIAVLALGVLGAVLGGTTGRDETRLFFVSVSVTYALTLVLTGPVQMVLTRHAADQQFVGRPERIFAAFVSSLAWTVLAFALLGAVVFGLGVPGPVLFRLAATLLMAMVAAMWVSSVFLTALKSYGAVLGAFAAGFAVSLGASWGLARAWGVSGAMCGMALGHGVLVLCLAAAIFRELGSIDVTPPALAGCFRRYWDLALGGLLYNLGIWIDKFLYWWLDPGATPVAGILHASPLYDRVVYFGFLTVVPGMAVFLLSLETQFAFHHEAFFQHVLKKGTLSQIRDHKARMIGALRDGFTLLMKVQGLVTLVLILGAERVLRFLNLGAVQASIFQLSLLGVFLLVLFLSMETILYYLDKRRDAMFCCLVFAVLNGALTAWTIAAGVRWFGLGFMVAAGVATCVAAARVNTHLRNLEFDTFAPQPIYG
jgi:uncharacterized membrane protein